MPYFINDMQCQSFFYLEKAYDTTWKYGFSESDDWSLTIDCMGYNTHCHTVGYANIVINGCHLWLQVAATNIHPLSRYCTNKLVETLAKHSSSSNYVPQFQKYQTQQERKCLNFNSDNGEDYNDIFSINELHIALGQAHDTANIHYQLLKHLPESCFEYIWWYLDVWKISF